MLCFSDTVDNKEMEVIGERRDLAVEFLFCLALIEVLKQLPFHPGHEDLVTHIENLCFKHFKYREGYVHILLYLFYIIITNNYYNFFLRMVEMNV